MMKSLSVILLVIMTVAAAVTIPHGVRLFRRMPGPVRFAALTWWLLAVGTGVYFFRSGAVQVLGGLDSSARMQLLLYAVAGLVVLYLLFRAGGANLIIRLPVLALFFYGLTGFLSAVYSPAPLVTLYKAGIILLDVLAITACVSLLRQAKRPALVFDIAVGTAILFATGAFLGVLIRPQQAIRTIYGGGFWGFILDGAFPYMNGNELGFLSAVIALVALSRLLQPDAGWPRIFWLATGLIGGAGMLFAQARTSLLGMLLGVLVLSMGVKRLRIIAIAGLFVGGVAGLSMVAMQSDWNVTGTVGQYLAKGQTDEGLQSFYGRITAWRQIGLVMFEASPVLGHGFETGVRYGGKKFGIGDTHLHNSHFQILANSGLMGYLPWVVMVGWVFFKFTARILTREGPEASAGKPKEYEMYAVLIMLLLRTITGSVMVNHSVTLIFLIGIMLYLLADSRNMTAAPVDPWGREITRNPIAGNLF